MPQSVYQVGKSILSTPRILKYQETIFAGDKVKLIEMVDCDTAEIEVKTKKTSKIKKAVLKPVWALKSLVRRIQVNRNQTKINRKT